jgi:hypothetical protein
MMIHVAIARRRREIATPSHAWTKHKSIEAVVPLKTVQFNSFNTVFNKKELFVENCDFVIK